MTDTLVDASGGVWMFFSVECVREGPTDRSYGIHIADLAGVPEPGRQRSWEAVAIGATRNHRAGPIPGTRSDSHL